MPHHSGLEDVKLVLLEPRCELIPVRTLMRGTGNALWEWALIPPFVDHETHVGMAH